ncbi:TPA: ATP-binding protein [Listeria innocua]|nr:ATP-binding protein [Listeria innocua]
MQLKTPLKAIHKNMMLTGSGEIWAYYRVTPIPGSKEDEEKMAKHKSNWRSTINELRKYKDFHLESYPREMELEDRFAELEKDFDSRTSKMGKYYNRETSRLLNKEMGVVTEEAYVMGVCLKRQLLTNAGDLKGMAQHVVSSTTDAIANLIGLEVEVSDDYFEKFYELEEELTKTLSVIGAIAINEDELVYINRYNFLRNIDHAVREEKEKRGLTNITDSIIDPTESGFLKLTTTEGESFMSFVVVDNFPLNMLNANLFMRAQNFNFPVELHVKGQFASLDTVKRKAKLTKTRFKSVQKEQRQVGEKSKDKIKKGYYALERLENNLEDDVPFVNWMASFVVYGKTKKQCKERANAIIRVMKRQRIQCVRPLADQLQLFYKFLHGKPLEFEKSWVQKTTAEGLAEVAYGINTRLGNNVGFYIERVDNLKKASTHESAVRASRKLVFYHPFIANKGITGAMTDSPHVAITGETGKGKSFLTKLLFIYITFLSCKVLYIDPKSEIENWFKQVTDDPYYRENYPLFVKHLESFHYVTLDEKDNKNWGVLDPIVFLKGADAKDTAQSMVEQVYDLNKSDEVKRVFLEEIDHVMELKKQGKRVGLLTVIKNMQTHKDKQVASAGRLLHQLTKNSVLQLAFSEGENDGLDLNNKINILQIAGLDLPKENDNPKYYSDAERKSLVLMIALGKFCAEFGARNPAEETVEIFDEAWIITSARGGKKITKSMRRIGRSFNNALFYITQSVSDVTSEDDRGNFGVVFAFDEPSERSEILKHMSMEDSQENKEKLSNMIKGECLMRDIYGRTGKIVVHCPFEEMRAAFKTVERNNSAEAEEKYAS